jgi:hypothetical protein
VFVTDEDVECVRHVRRSSEGVYPRGDTGTDSRYRAQWVCAGCGTNGMPRRQPGRSSAKAVIERMGTAGRTVNSQEGLGLLVHSGGRVARDAPALSLCRKLRGQASCSPDPTTVPASAGFSILTAAAATPQSGSRAESAARRDLNRDWRVCKALGAQGKALRIAGRYSP